MNVDVLKPRKHYLVLGEQKYEVKFTLNTFAKLETIYGSMKAVEKVLGEGSIVAIKRMLKAALVDCPMSEDEIADLIEFNQMKEIQDIFEAAMSSAMPKKKGTMAEAHGQAQENTNPNQ